MDAEMAIAERRADVTIDEVIGRYELSNVAEGKSPATVKWYSEIIGTFLAYVRSKYRHDDLSIFTKDVVMEYILYLRQRPRYEGHPYMPRQGQLLSAKTVQCHIRALKAFSSWLYRDGYTQDNRLVNLKLPKAPLRVLEPLSSDEVKAVLSSIVTDSPVGVRNRAIVVTALDTGLRASEIGGITLGRVNLDAGYIKVMGKGSKERIVPVGKYVQKVLWSYITDTRSRFATGECDNLFLSRSGKPITVNTIKLLFSRLARTSGVERLHAHLCRHTFAIDYLLNGGDAFSLQAILGHSSLEMVRNYLHFTSSQIVFQHHKYSPIDRLHKPEVDK
jgi:site-specific recombinase XerD